MSLNTCTLIGNLGADPETRDMPNGGVVTDLSLAMSEKWTDKQSGQKQERTEWIRVSLFGKQAEVARDYLRKGREVCIVGQIRTDKYQDKQTGQDRYSTKVIARQLVLLSNGGQGGGQSSGPAQSGPAAPADDTFDDDVPF